MAVIAARVLSEHAARFQQACADLSQERSYADQDLQVLTTAIEGLDLIRFGKIRARWLLHLKDYAATHAFGTQLIADLLLTISFVASTLAASIRLRDDGAIELWKAGHLVAVVGLATGQGIRSLLEVEARLAVLMKTSPWQDPVPGRILVTGHVPNGNIPTAPVSIVEEADKDDITNPRAPSQLLCAYQLRASTDILGTLTS